MTPAGTSNELDVQNEWEENTHTHTHTDAINIALRSCIMTCCNTVCEIMLKPSRVVGGASNIENHANRVPWYITRDTILNPHYSVYHAGALLTGTINININNPTQCNSRRVHQTTVWLGFEARNVFYTSTSVCEISSFSPPTDVDISLCIALVAVRHLKSGDRIAQKAYTRAHSWRCDKSLDRILR